MRGFGCDAAILIGKSVGGEREEVVLLLWLSGEEGDDVSECAYAYVGQGIAGEGLCQVSARHEE